MLASVKRLFCLNDINVAVLFLGIALLSMSNCRTGKKIVNPPLPSEMKTLSEEEKMFNHLVLDSDVFSDFFTGFFLLDPSENKVLYQSNADKYFTPASNTKLFTFYTALNVLGDSIPALKYVIRGDSLIFWGTGDPSFLNPNLEENRVVINFLKSRKEKLFFSSHNFQDGRYGTGWAWDDYTGSYQLEKSPMPMYGNVAQFSRKGNRLEVKPEIFRSYVKHNPTYGAWTIRRKELVNTFEYNQVVNFNSSYQKDVPFIYSDELLVQLLSSELRSNVQLYQQAMMPPKDAKVIYSMESTALYRRMMQESDNHIAEQLMLLCSGVLTDTLNVRKAIDYAQNNLITDLPDAPKWKDGSGLSRYNLMTPRSIVALLEKLYASKEQEELLSIFPAGGQSGTIKKWYKADPPFVYAKTGTLSNRHCLSGYLLTRSGKTLLFSFMHNNYVAGSSPVKREMEKVLRYIQQHY